MRRRGSHLSAAIILDRTQERGCFTLVVFSCSITTPIPTALQESISRSTAASGGRLDLIDIGSCYNPFQVFPEYNVRSFTFLQEIRVFPSLFVVACLELKTVAKMDAGSFLVSQIVRVRSSMSVCPQVTALDLYPMNPSVWQCDFLQLAITEGGAQQATEAAEMAATGAAAAAAGADGKDTHLAAGTALGRASSRLSRHQTHIPLPLSLTAVTSRP